MQSCLIQKHNFSPLLHVANVANYIDYDWFMVRMKENDSLHFIWDAICFIPFCQGPRQRADVKEAYLQAGKQNPRCNAETESNFLAT